MAPSMPAPAATAAPLIFGLFANGGQVAQTLCAVISTVVGVLGFVRATPQAARRRYWAALGGISLLAALALAWLGLHAIWPWATRVAVIAAMGVVAAYGRFGLAPAPGASVSQTVGHRLRVVDVEFEIAEQASIEYKRKLRVVVRNDADVEVVLGPGTKWKAGDLKTRTIPQHVWEVEPADGWHSNRWTHAEEAQVHLAPSQAARTWVGLHPNATAEEIGALRGRIGTLIVPVKPLGEEREQLPL